MRVPFEDLSRVKAAQLRLVAVATTSIDDAAVAKPSTLPGWSVGHVLTHIARNADSHRRRAEAAASGQVVEQYAGGYEGRAAEIETGATRSARELVDDIRSSGNRLMSAWVGLPVGAWMATSRDVGGTERPLRELPARRWQELEVHPVDLRVGVTQGDWSDEFVSAWLPRLRVSLPRRLPANEQMPQRACFSNDREELAWLYGRVDRPDLPALSAWG